MQRLWTPWRMEYILSEKQPGCIFCAALAQHNDRETYIVYRSARAFAMLNTYPYNNGHLMIVPFEHLAALADAPSSSLEEMMRLAVRCEAALRSVYHPSGINLGMNLGRSAGAGIEGHFHLHVVPRWDGDTNFMTVVHGTRVIPEALGVTYRRLRPLLHGNSPGSSSPVARPRRPRRRGAR